MSDPSDDPVLRPPDTRSPDEIAFREDLKAYDNPEIYDNPSLPQVYKLRVWSYLLNDHPTTIRAELDGDILPDALVEGMFQLMSQGPELAKTLKHYGDIDLAEFRRQAEQEEGFTEWRKAQWEFFLRHFPKFLLAAYSTAFLSAFIATGLERWRKEPDQGLNEFEALARSTLKKQIVGFEKMIKEIVDTRGRGRPKKVIDPNNAPPFVNVVVTMARDLMGDETSKDTLPALKTIADKLDLTEDALGKRLREAGYSWTLIKEYLLAASLPKNPTEYSAEP